MTLPKIIYVMGAPGAGKGTQAALLAGKIGYQRFSTGDAFRAMARQDSELGRRVKEICENGFLAPAEMAAEIVMSAVKKHIERGEGLVFDGTPRTVKEAHMVDDFFNREGYGQPLVIYLKVDRDEMIRRNSIRRFCLGIKGEFPVQTDAEKQRCESLGGTIGTRSDDDPDKFMTRWDEFMKQTYPVVEEYIQRGIAHELDGMKSIDAVEQAVTKVVEGYEIHKS